MSTEQISKTSKAEPDRYSVVADHDQLPELTVTEQQLEAISKETFGDGTCLKLVSAKTYLDSPWQRTWEQFYRERIVHVESNNVLLLRFAYRYEVDLDRIKTERDLLAWVRQLAGKYWMAGERTEIFIEVVAQIKGFNLRIR
jgi:hypothetical protein